VRRVDVPTRGLSVSFTLLALDHCGKPGASGRRPASLKVTRIASMIARPTSQGGGLRDRSDLTLFGVDSIALRACHAAG
jgi:hypothetical protein